jgi:tripartite ATP-independent transporter DctP family solute receptor
MKKIFCLMMALGVVLVGVVLPASGAPRQLKINTISATDSPWHKAMLRFAQAVKEKTKGNIEVLAYPDGQLGDIQQNLTGMQMGTIEMGYFGLGSAVYLKDAAPIKVIYTPYLFKGKDEATKILNSDIFQQMYEDMAKKTGVRIFGAYGARSPRAIQTTRGPIVKPEDVRGMKLRIPGMDIFLATFEALGVKCTPLGMTEIYMALKQGVIEGQDNGFDLAVPLKFHEAAKYWSATDHGFEVTGWFISEKVWQSMSNEERGIFKEAAFEGGKVATELVQKLDDDSVKMFKASGVNYVVPDREAFRKALADVHKGFEGKVWPEGLVGRIREAQK